MFCSLFINTCIALLVNYVHQEHWVMEFFFDYNEYGPSMWDAVYPKCGFKHQSPIALDSGTAVKVETPTLRWVNWRNRPTTIKLKNSGHTAMLIASWDTADAVPYLSLSNSTYPYIFNQLHLHWGSKDEEGSEHTLNGKRFPLEMHVTLYRKDFGSYKKARRSPEKGALAVITIFYKIGESNYAFQRMIAGPVKHIKYWGMWVYVPSEPLETLIPQFNKDFFMYNGSLTTPPCSENVLFIISDNIRTLESNQLRKLRRLQDINRHQLLYNFRPIQELNDRQVFLIE